MNAYAILPARFNSKNLPARKLTTGELSIRFHQLDNFQLDIICELDNWPARYYF